MAQLFEHSFQGSGSGVTAGDPGPSKREDLADYIALIDAKDCPFTSMAPKGKDLGNMFHRWQVDQYETATNIGFVDGQDATATAHASAGVVEDGASVSHGADYAPLIQNHRRKSNELSNYGQYFRRATKVSPLAAQVTTPAGERDLLAAGVAKKTVELKRDMEKTFLSNNVPVVGTASVPYQTRGMGAWIQLLASDSTVGSSVYASELSTPGDSSVDITDDATPTGSTLTEGVLQGLLESIYGETGTVRSYNLICGTKVKRFVTGLTGTATETTEDASGDSVAATGVRTFNQNLSDTTLKNTIQVFEGDFGTLTLFVDSFTPDVYTGYVIPMEMTEIRYGMLPRVQTIPDSGSGEGRIVEAVASLVVRNPKGFGKLNGSGN